MKILGEAANVKSASRVFMELVNLSKRGNEITEQQVDYALDLAAKQENVGVMSEMYDDLICHTTAGKPIKPKTLGQKAYVDAIRKQMVVFESDRQEPERPILQWRWQLLHLKTKKWDVSY